MKPQSKPDSMHPRPVVDGGRVIGHVTQEPPTSGTVREWRATGGNGRIIGYAGTRSLAEDLVRAYRSLP